MVRCIVPGCEKISIIHSKRFMFTFPKKVELLQKWINAIPHIKPPIKSSWRVCQYHFETEDILEDFSHTIGGEVYLLKRERPRLKPNAVPTINLGGSADIVTVVPKSKLKKNQVKVCEKQSKDAIAKNKRVIPEDGLSNDKFTNSSNKLSKITYVHELTTTTAVDQESDKSILSPSTHVLGIPAKNKRVIPEDGLSNDKFTNSSNKLSKITYVHELTTTTAVDQESDKSILSPSTHVLGIPEEEEVYTNAEISDNNKIDTLICSEQKNIHQTIEILQIQEICGNSNKSNNNNQNVDYFPLPNTTEEDPFQSLFDNVFEVVLPSTLWGVHRSTNQKRIMFVCIDEEQLSISKMLSLDDTGNLKIYITSNLIREEYLPAHILTTEHISGILTYLDDKQICLGANLSEECEILLEDVDNDEQRNQRLCKKCYI